MTGAAAETGAPHPSSTTYPNARHRWVVPGQQHVLYQRGANLNA
jgi:hypothetical protein